MSLASMLGSALQPFGLLDAKKLAAAEKMLDPHPTQVIAKLIPKRVVSFDMECIDEAEAYSSILSDLASITDGDWQLDSLSIRGSGENEMGKIQIDFVFDGEQIIWEILQLGSDWVLPGFLDSVRHFAQTKLPGRFLMIQGDEQYAHICYLQAEAAAALEAALHSEEMLEFCEDEELHQAIWHRQRSMRLRAMPAEQFQAALACLQHFNEIKSWPYQITRSSLRELVPPEVRSAVEVQSAQSGYLEIAISLVSSELTFRETLKEDDDRDPYVLYEVELRHAGKEVLSVDGFVDSGPGSSGSYSGLELSTIHRFTPGDWISALAELGQAIECHRRANRLRRQPF